jgi:hypothetical protein
MGDKIVPLDINLVRYSDPILIKEEEKKLQRKVC